jgi:DNA polymerase V
MLKVKEIYGLKAKRQQKLPLFTAHISAGFPSPADDHIDKCLDLNEFIVKHPAATFFVKVQGDSMVDAGICSGDILVVDRSLTPANNRIVIARLSGELTVKRIRKSKGQISLFPENKDFTPILIDESMDFEVWGVVTTVIRSV